MTRASWEPTVWLGLSVSNLHGADQIWRAFLHREVRYILIVEDDLSVGGRFQAHHDLGEGRLATARFADDGNGLRLSGAEGNALVRLDVTDALTPDYREQGVVGQLVVLLHLVDVSVSS
jgi:hypothetical protein